jgi:hypothetical protein
MAPPTFVTEDPPPPNFQPQPIRPFTSAQLISRPLDLYRSKVDEGYARDQYTN